MARIPDETREAIAADIRAGGHRNAIAREHGVSPSTVTNIARDEGIADAFDRTATKKATEAARVDAHADAIEQAKRWHAFSSKLLTRLDEAPDEDWDAVSLLDIARIAGIAVDKGIALQRVGDPDADASQTLMAELLDGLRVRVGAEN